MYYREYYLIDKFSKVEYIIVKVKGNKKRYVHVLKSQEMERISVEQYSQLLSQFEKLKTKYDKIPDGTKDKIQADIIDTIHEGLNDLGKAISENNNNKVIELSFKIKVFLQGLKLSINKCNRQIRHQENN